TFQQMRRVCVPQPVRVRNDSPQGARVESPSMSRQEDRVRCADCERSAPVTEVARQRGCRLLAERHYALLAALAADEERLLLRVDVREMGGDCLSAAETAGVDELDEGPVAQGDRIVSGETRDERVAFGDLRRFGQPPRPSRPEGSVGNAFGPEREPEKRAN